MLKSFFSEHALPMTFQSSPLQLSGLTATGPRRPNSCLLCPLPGVQGQCLLQLQPSQAGGSNPGEEAPRAVGWEHNAGGAAIAAILPFLSALTEVQRAGEEQCTRAHLCTRTTRHAAAARGRHTFDCIWASFSPPVGQAI